MPRRKKKIYDKANCVLISLLLLTYRHLVAWYRCSRNCVDGKVRPNIHKRSILDYGLYCGFAADENDNNSAANYSPMRNYFIKLNVRADFSLKYNTSAITSPCDFARQKFNAWRRIWWGIECKILKYEDFEISFCLLHLLSSALPRRDILIIFWGSGSLALMPAMSSGRYRIRIEIKSWAIYALVSCLACFH